MCSSTAARALRYIPGAEASSRIAPARAARANGRTRAARI